MSIAMLVKLQEGSEDGHRSSWCFRRILQEAAEHKSADGISSSTVEGLQSKHNAVIVQMDMYLGTLGIFQERKT